MATFEQIEYLQQQQQDLRSLLNATCVALLFLTLGINIFVGKQTKVVRDQLGELRPQMQRLEVELRSTREPELRRFAGMLQQYAMTHPDFQPVVARYRVLLPQFFAATGSVVPGTESGNPLPSPKPPSR